MELDRRLFLQAAAGAALAGYVPLVAATRALAATGSTTLTMATFTPLVNSMFRFSVGGRTVGLPLKQVIDKRPPGTSAECFSLIFAGALPSFKQGTYAVDQASIGEFSLFVVPVGRRSDGQDYEAAFNRTAG